MIYEFLNKDGSFYTLIQTDSPQKELEATQQYNPNVASFREYIYPEIVEDNIEEAAE